MTPPPSTVELMRHVLADLDDARPRSQQTTLGPSELGTPCQRQIAMKLAGLPRRLPDQRPPWAPMQGTAIHALMEQALTFHNGQLGYARWVIEEKLHIDGDVWGHGDAYDTYEKTVVDWKYVGSTALREAKRKTVPVHELVGQEYRVQGHLYGWGHANAGRTVRWVRLVLLARSHNYDDSTEWTEAYNPAVARWAIDRYHATRALIAGLDLAANPALWPAVPATPSDKTCNWCPFRRQGGPADGTGCPGNTGQKIDKQVAGLITPAPEHSQPRCATTDLYLNQCAHCRPATTTARTTTAGLGPWIAAKYPGTCAGCGAQFDLFDRIRADRAGGWFADCCGNQ